MKIRSQMSLLILIALLSVTGVCLFITIHGIRKSNADTIAESRKAAMEATQTQLKSVVDIAFSALEQNLANMNDPGWLEKHYGNKLRMAMDSANCMLTPENSNFNPTASQRLFNDVLQQYFEQSGILLLVARMDSGKIIGSNAAINKYNSEKLSEFIRQKAPDNNKKIVIGNNSYSPKVSYFRTYPTSGLVMITALSSEEIQRETMERSKEEVRNCRYDNGVGYVFAIGTDCVCVVHPILAHLENTDMSLVRDSFGKLLIVDMVKVCLKENEGFVLYHWAKPRPGKPDLPEVPKITYVKLFKPWMWMLGSGAYIDNINENIARKEAAMQKQMDTMLLQTSIWAVSIAILMILISWYISRSLSSPLEQLTASMQKIDPNDPDTRNLSISLRGSTEIIQLGRIFNQMTSSIVKGINNIRDATEAKEKAESELKLAAEIQNDMIPKMFPPVAPRPEFEICAISIPSVQNSNGIYDCFPIDNDRVGLIIANVSRPGIAGALYNVIIRAIIRSKASVNQPGAVLNNINETLLRNRKLKAYVSIFFGILDLRSGELLYSNAGHSFPFIYRNQHHIEDIPTLHGEALCVHRNHFYAHDRIMLVPGDILVLYSEGLLRSAVGGQGMPRADFRSKMADAIRPSGNDTISQCILAVEDMFSGTTPAEDVTLVLFNFHGPQNPA